MGMLAAFIFGPGVNGRALFFDNATTGIGLSMATTRLVAASLHCDPLGLLAGPIGTAPITSPECLTH